MQNRSESIQSSKKHGRGFYWFWCFFSGKYESGDFEEDYEDMNDDLFVLPPPLPPLDFQQLDKDTELSSENDIQGS